MSNIIAYQNSASMIISMQRASFAEACNTGNCIKQKYIIRKKLQGATETGILGILEVQYNPNLLQQSQVPTEF